MLPLGLILGKYGVSFHSYAEDSQLHPKLWNSLPAYLRQLLSLNDLKKQLKTYFFFYIGF